MQPRTMTNPVEIKRFLLAGDATVTIKSLASGNHFTYRVTKAEPRPGFEWAGPTYFVKVLIGDPNAGDFVYVGLIDEKRGQALRRTAKSKVREDSPCVAAFRYFYSSVCQRGTIPAQLEVRHEGRCGRCHRELTHPESIDRGIGPDCWEQMHGSVAAA